MMNIHRVTDGVVLGVLGCTLESSFGKIMPNASIKLTDINFPISIINSRGDCFLSKYVSVWGSQGKLTGFFWQLSRPKNTDQF